MNKLAKLINSQPKPNSKRQQNLKENPETYQVIGCYNCHRTNVTLRKAKNSYYCIECYNNLSKEEK